MTNPKIFLFTLCVYLFHPGEAALLNTYQKFHQEIQTAMAVEDIKRAKAIVKELLPLLEEDIAYTQMVITEEDDDFFLGQLSTKFERQKEIKQQLEAFVKTKRVDATLSQNSMNMVRELRRLSSKPRDRG